MDFYFAGIDYQSVVLNEREEIIRQRKKIGGRWAKLSCELAVLSTCNRFEIYGISEKIEQLPFDTGWYFKSGKLDVYSHALRLAAGLESQIKGEIEILSQIEIWLNNLPVRLLSFWGRVYSDALAIRRESGLIGQYNIATLVFENIKKNLNVKNGRKKIVVIGTGKIALLLAKNRPVDIEIVFAAHRNKSAADCLAGLSGGKAIFLSDIYQELSGADILIGSTSSPHFILNKKDLESIMAGRKNTLYIYDLAIPRDIEPEVSDIKDVILYNLDDLSDMFKENDEKIKTNLFLAEYLVREKVKEYADELKNGSQAKRVIVKTG